MNEPVALQLLPVVSPLHRDDCVTPVIDRAAAALRELGHPVVVADGPEALQAGLPLVLMVVTGGTEQRVLEVLQRDTEPAVLLAHGEHNSLAAAIEVLARVREDGRRGCVVQLGTGDGNDPRMAPVLAALSARQRLRRASFGYLGGPSSWLVASSPDPAEVRSRYGCRIETIALDEVVDLLGSIDEAAAAQVTDELTASARSTRQEVSDRLLDAARVYLALQELRARYDLDGLSIRCFDLLEVTGTTACIALALLNDRGVVAGCEGDLPALLTMSLLTAICGRPSFMANPQEVSLADSSLWLAHCTVATSLCEHWSLDSHFESRMGVAVAGTLPCAPVTLARLGGSNLGRLFAADGKVIGCGTSRQRCRTQVRVQLEGGVDELVRRPLGNHLVMAEGHRSEVLGCFRELYLNDR